jgi:asparagine synthase (glutamine-hydrolysing)
VERVAGGARLHLSALDSGRIGAVIDRTVEAQAEPFGGVTVAGYDYLYAEAEQSGITVLLDGNGVDEVFLGYSKYLRDVGAAAAAGRRPAIDGTDGLMPSAIGPMLATGARTRPPAVAPVLDDGVKRAAALDLLSEKIPRGLRFNDRMSMARSRELRVPFLDHRLVEFGFAVPTTEHLAGGFTKSLFREIAEAWVPAEVARAPKRSVQSPQREWLAGAWRPLVEDLLGSKSLAARGWIDPSAARRAFAAYCAGPKENSFFVWQWLTLELWARRFLDGAGS